MAKQLTGQITVATAGTAVAGPSVEGAYFAVKGHPSNAGTVWLGNTGADDVDNASGFPLDPGEGIEVYARNLNTYWFDASNNGDKLCWLRVE